MSEDLDLLAGSFITHDGLTLASYRARASGEPRSPVILIHGFGDHSRSLPYLRLARTLSMRGFEVFAYDRRGAGRSQGLESYTPSWDDLMQDLARFVDIAEDQCGRLPALLGLSFGALQALDFALRSPESVPACVALSPALDVTGTSPWLRRILPWLARWFPKMKVDPGLDDSALTRDQVLLGQYRADPLWQKKTTPALGAAAMGAVLRVQGHASEIKTPTLLFHGTADRVVPIQGTRSFFANLGSKDKTFVEVPGAFHALPIEPEGPEIAGQIADWLSLRRPPPRRPNVIRGS